MTNTKNHWSNSDKRGEIIKKVSVGWSNLIPKIKTGEYRTCPICSKSYYVKRCHFHIYKTCSRKCQGVAKRGIIPSNLKYAQSKSPILKKGHKFHVFGENHPGWQKENPSYRAVHAWMRKKYGSAMKCENPDCKYPRKSARGKLIIKPTFQWANISGTYKRDRSDFIQLCASCHKLYDLGNDKIKLWIAQTLQQVQTQPPYSTTTYAKT